jgi:hypothetical protein
VQAVALAAQEVLDLWERADSLPPLERALVLAAAAPPARTLTPPLPDAPVGACHAALLRLRVEAFGPRLEALATCPGCVEQVELVVDARALVDLAEPPGATEGVLDVAGWTVRWRCPTWADLSAVAGGDPDAAEDALLGRIVLEVRDPAGSSSAPAPREVRDALAGAVADADPLAEVVVQVCCPGCGLTFTSEIDPVAYLWTEVVARARRLLREVDALARTYGWSEADVLSLGESRRAAYLNLSAGAEPWPTS